MKKSWEIKKLGEICEVITKGTTPTSLGFKFTDEGVNFIKVESLTESGQIIPNKVAYISEECHESLKRSQLKENDILFSIAGALGRIGIVNKAIIPANTNQALAIVRLAKNSGISVSFLAKYFTSNIISEEIEKLKGGAAQQNLSLGQLNNLPIPLPPLPEQQSIVVTLDEAFTAIAKAKANAEQNLKNTKELFESYLQRVFKNKGEGWEEKTLGEIASFSQGIQVGLEQHLTEPKTGYVRFIRIVDYTQNTDDIRYVPDPGEKYLVKEDDIVMVRYGTPGLIGRGKAGIIANNLFKITIENNALSKDFLCLCLSQKHIQIYLSTQGSATMPALNFGQLKTVAINFPSLKEQNKIVEKLDVLSTETKKLEAIYQQKINDLEELKKSVLQKAFSGELKTEKALV